MYVEREIHTLRTRVTHLEKQVSALMRKMGMGYSGPDGDRMPTEVHELALKGDKKGAIRLYREMTGATLKESKEAVEGLS